MRQLILVSHDAGLRRISARHFLVCAKTIEKAGFADTPQPDF